MLRQQAQRKQAVEAHRLALVADAGGPLAWVYNERSSTQWEDAAVGKATALPPAAAPAQHRRQALGTVLWWPPPAGKKAREAHSACMPSPPGHAQAHASQTRA